MKILNSDFQIGVDLTPFLFLNCEIITFRIQNLYFLASISE